MSQISIFYEEIISKNQLRPWSEFAIPPTSYRGLSGPSGPSVPGSVPESVPENGGVRRSVPRGVSGALWAPGSGVSKKCPESVPRVSGDAL